MNLTDLIGNAEELSLRIDAPQKLIVSPEIWKELERLCSPRSLGITDVKVCGLPVFAARFFKPDWWAEEYADRMVLHHLDGQVTIPKPTRLTVEGFPV